MRWSSFLLCLAVVGCGKAETNAQEMASAEAKSMMGPISRWKLDPAVNRAALQQMRDRAYVFCLTHKASDRNCPNEQDWSLFTYANAFSIVRQFRSEADPTFPFARGHKLNPSAFDLPRRYCLSVYTDGGSGDARSLGPCMSAAIGGDYFRIVPVS